MMRLRRKTDPNTGKNAVCERHAHGHFTRAILYGNFEEKWPRTPPGTPFRASLHCRKGEGHLTRAILWKFAGKMPHASPTDIVLCEPAQLKCTWTFHKSHFARKFTGKMPDTPDSPDTTSIEHRALTVTIRTPQCGHTVWGIFCQWFIQEMLSFTNFQRIRFVTNSGQDSVARTLSPSLPRGLHNLGYRVAGEEKLNGLGVAACLCAQEKSITDKCI